ncbi:hypothetical protein [Streptomyces sp. KL116D]|uniref:hypothetical protein n=1 Tax=Streptomyces sp. KL116D TaxID=3045152 RepID=UPI003558EFA9
MNGTDAGTRERPDDSCPAGNALRRRAGPAGRPDALQRPGLALAVAVPPPRSP